MDMVVAAGGGERDEAVDAAILAASHTRNDRDVLLNEKLTTELRPTLFLAQLSNLLAGNISIVHKVTGSSRTFMGEEGAGVSAVDTAAARIRSGQSTHALVGGAFNAEHPDMLLGYELGGYLHRGPGVRCGSAKARRAVAWSAARAPPSWCWNRANMPKGAALQVYAQARSRSRRKRPPRRSVSRQAIAELIATARTCRRTTLAISGASGAHEATTAEKRGAGSRRRPRHARLSRRSPAT